MILRKTFYINQVSLEMRLFIKNVIWFSLTVAKNYRSEAIIRMALTIRFDFPFH